MEGKGQVGVMQRRILEKREMTCDGAEKEESLVSAEDGNSLPREDGVSQRVT